MPQAYNQFSMDFRGDIVSLLGASKKQAGKTAQTHTQMQGHRESHKSR